jgi:outer membrane lipoprotein-sorting protein
MKPEGNIEKLVRKFCVKEKLCIKTSAEMDKRILDDAVAVYEKSKRIKSAESPLSIRRTIMRSRLTKLATAAVIIFIVVLGITLLDKLIAPAWAIEQTVEALERIETLTITGVSAYGYEQVPFKCWIKFSGQNGKSLNIRYECEREIVVVRDNLAFGYDPRTNKVVIFSGPKIHQNLQVLCKIRELSPWIAGRMLEVLKLLTDDWQETYEKNPQTGSDRVIVTCSYKPLNASFWFVVDLKSKLIIEGKHWFNTNREGTPNLHADSFAYNQDIPDQIFDFKIPGDAKVINQQDSEQADILFDKAFKLFNKDKNYPEAIKIFQQVYESYPEQNIAEESLSMIGLCYSAMGDYQKAIESFEKAVSEYPNLKGWIESTYFYLGNTYMKTGQKSKALEAFKNCLIMGEGIRDPNTFPLKDARGYIEKLGIKE